jgi:hypothetical protein
MPVHDESEGRDGPSATQAVLPLGVIEAAIKLVVQRNNYGLDSFGGAKTPAALCVWRWEVKEQHRDWLPKNVREKVAARIAERVQVNYISTLSTCFLIIPQAKQDLLRIVEALPQQERDAILDPKSTSKLLPKEVNASEASKPIDLTVDDSQESMDRKAQGENEENNGVRS